MKEIQNWRTITLGDVCRFIGGNGFREELQGQRDGDYPFIKVSDMELPANKRMIVQSNNWIDEQTRINEAFNVCPKSAVVFAKVGAALLLNRRRILTMPTCIDNNMMAAVPNGIDPIFLYYVLSHIDFADFVQSGAVPSINQSQISAVRLGLPHLVEQAKIAEILSAVDRAIEQTEALIAKQQRIKTGLMQDLLTRGIDEQGNLRSEETHEFKDSPLGRIPVEWEVTTLGTAVWRNKGSIQTGPFGSQLHAEDYQEEGIPIITVEHLSQNKIIHKNLPFVGESDYRRLAKYSLSEGDLVFSRVGSIDRCSYVSKNEDGWLFSGRCLRVRSGRQINSKYLGYQLGYDRSCNWILNNSVGSTMACLNTSILSMVPIALPQREEQDTVARALDSVSDTIHCEMLKKIKLCSLKTALMQDLLTGKVRVTSLLKGKD